MKVKADPEAPSWRYCLLVAVLGSLDLFVGQHVGNNTARSVESDWLPVGKGYLTSGRHLLYLASCRLLGDEFCSLQSRVVTDQSMQCTAPVELQLRSVRVTNVCQGKAIILRIMRVCL